MARRPPAPYCARSPKVSSGTHPYCRSSNGAATSACPARSLLIAARKSWPDRAGGWVCAPGWLTTACAWLPAARPWSIGAGFRSDGVPGGPAPMMSLNHLAEEFDQAVRVIVERKSLPLAPHVRPEYFHALRVAEVGSQFGDGFRENPNLQLTGERLRRDDGAAVIVLNQRQAGRGQRGHARG